MKKILTAALAVIVAALSLTGCDNNSTSNNNNSSNTTSSTTVSTPEDTVSNPEDTSSSDETSSDPDEESIPSLTERLEFPDNKAGNMVKAAFESTDEWSMAMSIADEETFSALLSDLSPDMFEEYCFAYDMIGINGHSVFAGKPKAGQEDAVNSAFEESLAAFKDRVSFYPAGQASAEGAQTGTTNDGYCYFVIHANGAAIADAMTK